MPHGIGTYGSKRGRPPKKKAGGGSFKAAPPKGRDHIPKPEHRRTDTRRKPNGESFHRRRFGNASPRPVNSRITALSLELCFQQMGRDCLAPPEILLSYSKFS